MALREWDRTGRCRTGRSTSHARPLSVVLTLGLLAGACKGSGSYGAPERPREEVEARPVPGADGRFRMEEPGPGAFVCFTDSCEPFTVARVVDGDTFKAEELAAAGAPSGSVRLWGIDAPERGDRPAGPDATAWLRAQVEAADRRLYCERVELDRYSRLVARCFTPDGTDIQAAMIAAGHAVEWCRYSDGAYGECDRPGGRSK